MQTSTGKALLGTVFIFLVLLASGWQASRWYEAQLLAEERNQAKLEISLRADALSAAVNRRFALLQGLRAFVITEADTETIETKFLDFASNLYINTSGIHNITIAPSGIIEFIYPLEGNQDLIGYNLLETSQPDIELDIQRTVNTEEIVIGYPLDYAQGGWGLAERQAVFLADDSFWGIISIVIDIPTLLNDAGLDDISSQDLNFALRDHSGETIFETGAPIGGNEIAYKVELPVNEWELIGYPQRDWRKNIANDVWLFNTSEMIILALLTGIAFLGLSRQARLTEAVRQRTQEIAFINTTLEKRVEMRTRELSTLLRISRNVASTLELEPLVGQILDQLQAVVAYSASAIFLLDKERPDAIKLLRYKGQINTDDLPIYWNLDEALHYKEVLHTQEPVIIPDTQADTKLARAWQAVLLHNFGEIPADANCWMGVPMKVKNNNLGILILHHEKTDYYSEQDADLASAFASQFSLAIENARLHEQAQQVAVLRERQRLARELHDSVSQALYGIALGARTAKTLLEDDTTKPDSRHSLIDSIQYILSLAEAGLSEMRALIFELRPESLELEGLVMALTKQADALDARHQIQVETHLCPEPPLSLEKKQVLYRIAQESLHNIRKHARASHVDVRLSMTEDRILLEIGDNGRGFEPSNPTTGFGLQSMQERVQQVEGIFELESAPGTGTRIRIQVPVASAVHP